MFMIRDMIVVEIDHKSNAEPSLIVFESRKKANIQYLEKKKKILGRIISLKSKFQRMSKRKKTTHLKRNDAPNEVNQDVAVMFDGSSITTNTKAKTNANYALNSSSDFGHRTFTEKEKYDLRTQLYDLLNLDD
eukprot:99392_1